MMKWLALLSLVVANFVWLPAPVVRTGSGAVRGRLSGNGRFYQYFGIPYGTVDDTNRFRAPLPPPRWEGVFEATEENVRCPQQLLGSVVIGHADCLKLNIYTPTRNNQLLPVMVYIHGGCFFEGTGSGYLYGADYLVEQGIVFVGINYRLNVEGFLCLGIDEAPGNAGLKDQIAALKWIKENIAAFGGDPDNVTVFGESAGAVSTSYLILSPAARGLFHKAILQSGSTLAPWALQHEPLELASNLAKEFGSDTKDPYELYSILSNKTVPELINAIKYSQHRTYITSETLFAPCIEKHLPGVEPAITQYSIDIIESGNYSKIPMIIGFNNNEGMFFVAKDYGLGVTKVNPMNLLLPDLSFFNEYEKNETADGLMQEYFSKYDENEDKTMGMVDLYSDMHFKFPSLVESELYSRTNDQPMYYYIFKYNGYFNLPKLISLFVGSPGATHADELFYLFKPYSIPLPNRYIETDMIRRMVTMWTNFAKYSDPTPKSSRLVPVRWRPSRHSNPVALVIDAAVTTEPMWNAVSAPRFLNDTYSRYRRRSYNTFSDIGEYSFR